MDFTARMAMWDRRIDEKFQKIMALLKAMTIEQGMTEEEVEHTGNPAPADLVSDDAYSFVRPRQERGSEYGELGIYAPVYEVNTSRLSSHQVEEIINGNDEQISEYKTGEVVDLPSLLNSVSEISKYEGKNLGYITVPKVSPFHGEDVIEWLDQCQTRAKFVSSLEIQYAGTQDAQQMFDKMSEQETLAFKSTSSILSVYDEGEPMNFENLEVYIIVNSASEFRNCFKLLFDPGGSGFVYAAVEKGVIPSLSRNLKVSPRLREHDGISKPFEQDLNCMVLGLKVLDEILQLECYNRGYRNVFLLGFISSKAERAVVLLFREPRLNVIALKGMNWDLSQWCPLINNKCFLLRLVMVFSEQEQLWASQTSAQQINKAEEHTNTNLEVTFEDLQKLGDELHIRYSGNAAHSEWQSGGQVLKLTAQEGVALELRARQGAPADVVHGFIVEFVWRSIRLDQMQGAMKTFAIDETSVSGYIYYHSLGLKVEDQMVRNALPRHFGATSLKEHRASQVFVVKSVFGVLREPISLIEGPPDNGKIVISATIGILFDPNQVEGGAAADHSEDQEDIFFDPNHDWGGR